MYIKQGDAFIPTNHANLDIQDTLPPGNYTVKEDPKGNLYYQAIQNFPKPGKIYGNYSSMADRILETYNSRSVSTGVMLTGEKGSGKTLMAKLIATRALETQGVPTIVISYPWHGEQFNKLIQDVPEAIIIFDEFEKVYHESDHQHSILTLLDGVFPSKKMYIITTNDKWLVDDHMHNRPGRIFYAIDYAGLTEEFIMEYANDKLDNKDHIIDIVRASTLFKAFNFDMLQALVEEMNRYKETPYQALKMLNIRPKNEGEYEVSITYRGLPVPDNCNTTDNYHGHPLSRDYFWVRFKVEKSKDSKSSGGQLRSTSSDISSLLIIDGDDEADEDLYNYYDLRITRDKLINQDLATGEYVFDSGEGVVAILKKVVSKETDYYSFMAV